MPEFCLQAAELMWFDFYSSGNRIPSALPSVVPGCLRAGASEMLMCTGISLGPY